MLKELGSPEEVPLLEVGLKSNSNPSGHNPVLQHCMLKIVQWLLLSAVAHGQVARLVLVDQNCPANLLSLRLLGAGTRC